MHRFGWISERLDALGENISSQTSEILDEVGIPRDEEFVQILQDIPEGKYEYAVGLFQCMVAATRPLSLKELVDISLELDSKAGPHEDAVLTACPDLIRVVRDEDDHPTVHFTHKSVKDFLTSSRLRALSVENGSRFSLKAANTTLARVCVHVLLRFDDEARKTQLTQSPLALYAARHWVQHTQQGSVSTENQAAMERLFDPSKSHLEAWLWMHDVDKSQSRTVEDLAERPPYRRVTPLYYAAFCGFTELVKHLVTPEGLIDSRGYHGTPLHAASFKGHNEVVQELLRVDGDFKILDKEVRNKTPLQAAYYGGQLKTMAQLLEKGAEVDLRPKGALDNTLLHCASLDGRLDVVKLLIKFDAVVDARDRIGWTPLHRAALRERLDVAEYLLRLRFRDEEDENSTVEPADVDAQSNNKNTPLHVASIVGNFQIVELLMKNGARRDIKGEHGWTPAEAAEKSRHEKIVERLLRGRSGGDLFREGFDRLRRYYPRPE